MTARLQNVYTASYKRGRISFGDLQDLGLLEKSYRKGWDPECMDIVWRVVGDVEFTDSQGNCWKQGDEIVWEK